MKSDRVKYILNLIKEFNECQSVELLNELKDCGIDVMEISQGRWVVNNSLNLPFKRFVLLFNDEFEPNAIGVY